MGSGKSFDYIAAVLDEIALEGLDGITLPSLWVRLENRKGFCLTLDNHAKRYLWKAICVHPELEFHILPKPRPVYVPFSRYDHRDSETGMCLEILKDSAPTDIYPINIVDDKANNIRGSCSTISTRRCITDQVRPSNKANMAYEETLEKNEHSLVVVASQKVRLKVLFGESTDPQLEISGMQYTMLEMIARSREHGVVTTGQVCSFVGLNESPKSLFYHRKLLMKKHLIKRQLHFQRNKNTTQWGFVFHLPRFFVERPTAVNLMLQKLCMILQNKPHQREQFSTLRNEAGIPETTFKKILARGQPLSQFTEVSMIKYREMYPNAPNSEAFSAKKTEKQIKVVKLVRPFSWNSLLEDGEADDDDEDGDFEDNSFSCDSGRYMMTRPIVCQAYDILYKHSPEGLSERELQKYLGITRLDARSVCRYLTRAKVVATYMKDKGRQRLTMYVVAEHLHMSQSHQSILEERQKILESESIDERNSISILEDNSKSIPVTLTNRVFNNADSSRNFNLSKSLNNSSVLSPGGANTSIKKDADTSFNIYDKNLTAKQLSRANFILETVRKQVFIDDIYKLQRALSEKETKEGCETKLDKRSVMTLVQKLANDGHIKSMIITLKMTDNIKKLHFVCLPEVNENYPQVQSAIQSAKLRLLGLKYTDAKKIYENAKKEKKPSSNESANPDDSMSETPSSSYQDKKDQSTEEWKSKTAVMKFNPSMGKKYGLLPKFCRANLLHEVLFYLVHDYQGSETVLMPNVSSDEVMIMDGSFGQISNQPIIQPTVYSEQKNWKMFISPLPVYEGYPSGWCLVSDILQRLPASVFIQIVNIPFEIEGFNEIISHPIKKHYLISDLPTKLRNSLLISRRYIFHINDILIRLCYMGLISFGPQIHKDKDQVFIYVHRVAGVMDTSISDPGHFHISCNQDYSWRYHFLNSMMCVSTYWLDLRTVCISTMLGKKTVEKEPVTFPQELAKYLEPKNVDNIVDEGSVPGDHMGAGGLDSSLCSYLKRNWSSTFMVKSNSTGGGKKKNQKETKTYAATPLPQLLDDGNPVFVVDNKKRLNRLPKKTGIGLSKSKNSDKNLAPVSIVQSCVNYNRKISDIRTPKDKTIMKRKAPSDKATKPAKRKKHNFDSIDLELRNRMNTLRSTWTSQEDTFLMLCRASSILMGSKGTVPSTLLRDEHQKFYGKKFPKTSEACARRLNFICKEEKSNQNITIMVQQSKNTEALRAIGETKHAFGSKEWIKSFQDVFKELVSVFSEKNYVSFSLPNTYEEFQEKYSLSMSGSVSTQHEFSHSNPKNIVDIYYNVVFNIIMVSVSNIGGHANYSYHLYKLLTQYPDNLLRSVMVKMRKDRVISARKSYIYKKISHLVNTVNPYCLSISLRNNLATRYQNEIFDTGYNIFEDLICVADSDNPFVVLAPNKAEGFGMAMQALLAKNLLVLRTEVPDEIIQIDENNQPPLKQPKLSAKSESAKTKPVLPSTSTSSEVTFSAASTSKDQASNLPASRLGLHLMRRQIFVAPQYKNIQHSIEYFVVNSCDVFGKLRGSIPELMNSELVKSWTKSKQIKANDNLSIQEFCTNFELKDANKAKATALYDFISQSKVLGVSEQAIVSGLKSHNISPSELLSLLSKMLRSSLIARVGVQSHMYVSMGFVFPWLMRTLVIPKEKKALANKSVQLEGTASAHVLNVEADLESINLPENSEATDVLSAEEDCLVVKEVSASESSQSEIVRENTKKKKKKMAKELLENNDVISEGDCIKVDVIGRPWHKPDGSINKNMLFTYLQSVACYVSLNPGISENGILSHYLPYLQPVYVLDILEMLFESECISKLFMRKAIEDTGPFSSCSYEMTYEQGIYEDHETHYEPSIDILLKIACIKKILNLKETL